MKEFWVKAVLLSTGEVRHITGEWADVDAMADELARNGMVVLSYGRA